ncbi:protein of unknown function [Fibrobacter sp. UWH6]|nr:DUF4157 domain-containing protein [Fibrobacter sp. UWH6]SHK70722.1 protein of unknown function [Fibrobacter sp. UWH6]
MQCTYVFKSSLIQKASANTAESVVDSSSQSATLQRHASLANAAVQRAENPPRPNNTGLPDDLKNGIESLSGYSLDNVRVHYNSPKSATVQALAYTQGTDIHVAPGQEHALPHEAWHVTQQMAGRVTPTTNIGGMPVNDNAALEHEADVMGEKAVTQRKVDGGGLRQSNSAENTSQLMATVLQCGKHKGQRKPKPDSSYVEIGNIGKGQQIYCYKSNVFDSPSTPLSELKKYENLYRCIDNYHFGDKNGSYTWRLDSQNQFKRGDTPWLNLQIQLNGVHGEKSTYAVIHVPQNHSYHLNWLKRCLKKSVHDKCIYVIGTENLLDEYLGKSKNESIK